MAEPPAAASSGIAAPERDVLLATKLYLPASQPGLYRGRAWRNGLMRALSGG